MLLAQGLVCHWRGVGLATGVEDVDCMCSVVIRD